ncbi:hypothetical protein G6F35_012673 [Rhizopus arrhizus]|nr:hypothetical protein G6F35_012673 [Rhizopus arrhizus]
MPYRRQGDAQAGVRICGAKQQPGGSFTRHAALRIGVGKQLGKAIPERNLVGVDVAVARQHDAPQRLRVGIRRCSATLTRASGQTPAAARISLRARSRAASGQSADSSTSKRSKGQSSSRAGTSSSVTRRWASPVRVRAISVSSAVTRSVAVAKASGGAPRSWAAAYSSRSFRPGPRPAKMGTPWGVLSSASSSGRFCSAIACAMAAVSAPAAARAATATTRNSARRGAGGVCAWGSAAGSGLGARAARTARTPSHSAASKASGNANR